MRLPAAPVIAPLAALLTSACAGSSASSAPPATTEIPAPSAASAPARSGDPSAAPSTEASAAAAHTLPTACADPAAALCTPPSAFVERLCVKPHQEVALALFGKATPFTRVYLRGKLDELLSDEEVLVLGFHAPAKNGIVVGSGNGTYDLLRWDGSCSMGIEAEAIGKSRPARPRSATVQWHRIGPRLQDALIASSDGVKHAHAKRGKECKGAMSGEVSAACAKADQALIDAIVDYVRGGGALPEPDAP